MFHCFGRALLSLGACVAVALSAAALPTVSNVTMTQQAGSRFVDITYDLTGEAGIVLLSIETNGVSIGSSHVMTLAGDVSHAVQPGTGLKIRWDARKDWPNQLTKTARARVTAWSMSEPPLYCAIDVSAGTSATAYPMSYYASAEDVPGGVSNDLYKTTCILMRRIDPTPLSGFLMGSPTTEIGRNATKETQVSVTLTKPYYIGVYEVTQQQWQQVMGDVKSWPSYFSNQSCRERRPVEKVSYYHIRENAAANKHDEEVDWPANSKVSANSFMGRMRAKAGLSGFDLPTEAQWEWACRAGTTGALNDGTVNMSNKWENDQIGALARYIYNGGKIKTTWNEKFSYWDTVDPAQGCTTENGTAIVGSYEPNAWGLYDMHGNVAEWCLDWHADVLTGGENPTGPSTGTLRSRRGGSCYDTAQDCRSAYRGINANYKPNTDLWDWGFRPVINLP